MQFQLFVGLYALQRHTALSLIHAAGTRLVELNKSQNSHYTRKQLTTRKTTFTTNKPFTNHSPQDCDYSSNKGWAVPGRQIEY